MNDNSQRQNEALVRLMLAARYMDAKLTLAESDALDKKLQRLDWKSGTNLGVFVSQETARVCETISTLGGQEKFLASECAQFKSPESRADAVKTITDLLQADGLNTKECRFLAQIERLLST